MSPGRRGSGSDSQQNISWMFPVLNWKIPFHMVLLISNQTRMFDPLRETSCSKAGEGYRCSEKQREVIQEMVWRILVHPNPQKVRFVKHKSNQEIFNRINERIGPRSEGKEHLWFQAVNTQS